LAKRAQYVPLKTLPKKDNSLLTGRCNYQNTIGVIKAS